MGRIALVVGVVMGGTLGVWAEIHPDQEWLADGLYARGMYELALREYTALEGQPGLTNREVLLYRMAESLRHLGRSGEARARYTEILTGYPESGYARRAALRQAEDALQAGRYAEVVDLLARPGDRTVEPELRPAWRYFLAHAHHQLQQPGPAEPLYRRLLREDGGSPYAPFARLELAALIQARNPSAPEVTSLLQETADAAPDTPAGRQAVARLAVVLYERKEYAGSADAYAALAQRDPAQAATVRVASAWAHFKAGRWPATLELTATASDADSLYLQANALRLLDRPEEALRIYPRLVEQYPQHELADSARYESAVLHLDRKEYAQARQLAAAIKPTAERGEEVRWLQAEAARGAGARDEALDHYDRLVRDFPAGARAGAARFQAAQLVQEAGRWEEASQRFRAVAGDPACRAWAGEAWYASAYARQQLGQLEEAIRDWTHLEEAAPDFPSLDEVLYARAHAEAEVGRPAEARVQWERLLARFPKSRRGPEAHYRLGMLLELEDKWEAAEYHYRLATRGPLDPALARRIEFRRVAALQRQGRNDESAEALNQLLARDSAPAEVPAALLDWLARWNAQQQRWPEAERASVLLAGQGGAWIPLGWYQAGLAREAQGRSEEARTAYRQVPAEPATRESVDAAYRLGRLAAQAGDAAEARRALTQAAEQADDESLADLRARSYLALAGVAEQEGKAEEALRMLLSVALLYDDPELTPEALYRAAVHLHGLGRNAERDQTLQELKQRYPGSPWAAKDDVAPR